MENNKKIQSDFLNLGDTKEIYARNINDHIDNIIEELKFIKQEHASTRENMEDYHIGINDYLHDLESIYSKIKKVMNESSNEHTRTQLKKILEEYKEYDY